jgi:hypothetical protein
VAKVAVLVLAEAETHESLGRLVNAFMTAKELQDHDDEVQLVFDGGGTKGLAEIANPDHDAHKLYTDVSDKVAGACSYCAKAFGVQEELEELNVQLLDDFAQHPSLRSYIADGYQVISF